MFKIFKDNQEFGGATRLVFDLTTSPPTVELSVCGAGGKTFKVLPHTGQTILYLGEQVQDAPKRGGR